MSKLETNTIDTISGTTNLTIGSTNSSTVTFENGAVTGHMYPAFEAYLSSDQSVSNATATKVQFNTEVFDTDNMYDNSTNYRFTPTVAGKYYVYTSIKLFGNGDIEVSNTHIYKNGSLYRGAAFDPVNTSNAMNASNLFNAAIISMNGSSDYLEIFGLVQSGGTTTLETGIKNTFFGAYRIGA